MDVFSHFLYVFPMYYSSLNIDFGGIVHMKFYLYIFLFINFFSPLWLLNFESLLKLSVPLQSCKGAVPYYHSLLLWFCCIVLSLNQLELNLWFNFIFLHRYLYHLFPYWSDMPFLSYTEFPYIQKGQK